MTTVAPSLDVRAVSKVYRHTATEVWALRDVSLRVAAGQMLSNASPSHARS